LSRKRQREKERDKERERERVNVNNKVYNISYNNMIDIHNI